MKFILFLFLSFNVQAGLLDFLHIKQANEAYQNGDYPTATEKFSQIDTESARLNQGNSLYKQGLYKQSLLQYQKVKQKNLVFERFYNSGNAYLKLGKIDKAIASYEAALKIKNDKGALFNLELIEKNKKQKKQGKGGKNKGSKGKKGDKNKGKKGEKGDKNKSKKDEKGDKNKGSKGKKGKKGERGDKNKDNKGEKGDKNKDKKGKKGKKDDKNKGKKGGKGDKNKDKKGKKGDKNKDKKGKKGKKGDKNKQQVDKINDIVQRRWERKLYKKPKTLLIPLNKPQNNNDKNNKNLW